MSDREAAIELEVSEKRLEIFNRATFLIEKMCTMATP